MNLNTETSGETNAHMPHRLTWKSLGTKYTCEQRTSTYSIPFVRRLFIWLRCISCANMCVMMFDTYATRTQIHIVFCVSLLLLWRLLRASITITTQVNICCVMYVAKVNIRCWHYECGIVTRTYEFDLVMFSLSFSLSPSATCEKPQNSKQKMPTKLIARTHIRTQFN